MEATFDGNVFGCPCENVEAFPLFIEDNNARPLDMNGRAYCT